MAEAGLGDVDLGVNMLSILRIIFEEENSMKKIFVALSVLAALFIATPSMALVGTPDNVPGYDVQMPFFLVGMDGAGVDTLMVIQEVGGTSYAGPGGTRRVVGHGSTKGSVHSIIYDRYSIDRGSWTWTYTPDDVYPISIRYAIQEMVGVNDLPALEIDLDGDGVNDHYAGYIYCENSIWDVNPDTGARTRWPLNNLIGKQYLVDLPNGLASGANMVSREYCGLDRPVGTLLHPAAATVLNQHTIWSSTYYQYPQYTTTGRAINRPNQEVFNSEAYAVSSLREHLSNNSLNYHQQVGPLGEFALGVAPLGHVNGSVTTGNPFVATGFTLAPRFYLRTATANSYFFLWTDRNHGALAGQVASAWQWRNTVYLYNEDEYSINMNINLPYELNFINFVNELPGGATWAPPIGGWLDLNTLDANTFRAGAFTVNDITTSQWLGSTYQTDVGTSAALNWAALFEVHRDVGTL